MWYKIIYIKITLLKNINRTKPSAELQTPGNRKLRRSDIIWRGLKEAGKNGFIFLSKITSKKLHNMLSVNTSG